MRPEPGVSLVSGALQSSLAKAQRNYQFHGSESLYNSEERKEARNKKTFAADKQLTAYCNSIGSCFASYSAEQFLQLGNSLSFDDGGFLEHTIPEVRNDCVILKQNRKNELAPVGGSNRKKKKVIFSTIGNNKGSKLSSPLTSSPLCNGVIDAPTRKQVNDITVTESQSEGTPSKNLKHKKPGKFDTLIQKISKLLKDTTLGKNKRRRLTRKLRQLEKQKREETPTLQKVPIGVKTNSKLVESTTKSPSSSPIKKSVSPTANNGLELKPTKGTNLKTKMGPENGLKNDVALTNGTSLSLQLRLPEPKRILYPKEKILLGWRSKRGPGAGFHNFGNTCYLNSSLQALFHIPAFVNWIQNDEEHRKMCKGILPNQTTCIICVVYLTLQEHSRTSSCIRPRVLDKLKAICKHFSYGRQEDAHEFLRYLLEGMERSYLTLINGLRLDNRTKETNPLGQIFGGYIRTEVTCLQCSFVSTTFQPSAELQLDIRHSTTLEDALQLHFRRERLDNNDYKCEKCRKISQATKQFSLELPPLVLCLQLKRFTLYGNKIGKRIHCNKLLNMSRYLHKSQKASGFYQDNELKYRLVALVTHLGQSPNCGHYTAIAEGSNGSYYQFDDQFVQEVTGQTALNNDAYLLIYEMDRNSQPTGGGLHYSIPSSPNIVSKPATVTSGTLITNGKSDPPKKFAIPFAKRNGTSNSPALTKPTVMSNTDSSKANNSGPDSSGDRRVIRFGIPPNSLIKSPAQNKINVLQPGIVVTNSARVYSSSLSTMPSMVVPKANCVPLVPYGDIDNDEATEQEPKEEIRKNSPKPERIIGPLLETNNKHHHQRSPSPAAKVIIPYKLPSSPPLSPKPSNPEYKFGIKRKSEAMLGPTFDLTKSDMPTSKKAPLNATSKWTIVSLKNGNLSDPEKNSSESSKIKSKELIRAKSAERTIPKSQQSSRLTVPPPPPLIPNVKRKLNDNPSVDSTTKINGSSLSSQSTPKESSLKIAVQNGHHEKKKKRKRSRSSSSSSDSSFNDGDRSKQKKEDNGKIDKKKKLKKKERESTSRRPSSSSDDSSESDSDSSSGGRHHGHKRRHKNKKRKHSKHRDESKEKIKVSNSKGEMNGWLPTTERDASSVEREQILRQARNPSRSPSKSISSKSSERFNPSRIEGREKSIIGWNGEQSLLSKSIDDERKELGRKSGDGYDDELDQGRNKKQHSSPSRETPDGNKFQAIQDKKKLVAKWSTILDGYGDGFKDHANIKSPPSDKKKPWVAKKFDNYSDRSYPPSRGPRQNGNGFGGHNRPFGSYSSGYRSNTSSNSRSSYNGSNNRSRYYDNSKHWSNRQNHY